MKVCIGGTFNTLHKGHEQLFAKAFQIAGKDGTVFIGVTEGKMLKKKKIVTSFAERVDKINKYLDSKGYSKKAVVKAIYDKYGPAADGDYDTIIVSPETITTANEINKKREDNGLKPLKIIKIAYVLAEDNKPISATRVLNKEIDKEGRILL